jgi:alcohol dehydrogenase
MELSSTSFEELALQSNRIDAKQLIAHRIKLDRILQAYETFSRAADTKALKVIIWN